MHTCEAASAGGLQFLSGAARVPRSRALHLPFARRAAAAAHPAPHHRSTDAGAIAPHLLTLTWHLGGACTREEQRNTHTIAHTPPSRAPRSSRSAPAPSAQKVYSLQTAASIVERVGPRLRPLSAKKQAEMAGAAGGPTPLAARLARAQQFVVENFLPLSFAVAIIIAFAAPAPGRAVVHVLVGGDIHIIEARAAPARARPRRAGWAGGRAGGAPARGSRQVTRPCRLASPPHRPPPLPPSLSSHRHHRPPATARHRPRSPSTWRSSSSSPGWR